MGNNLGKLLRMVSINASRKTQLNIFLMSSTKKATLVGNYGGVCSCGWVMHLSIESCMVLMMKSIPLSISTAKLYGRSLCTKQVMVCLAMQDRMIRRRADSIPSRRSLVGSSMSLYSQKR